MPHEEGDVESRPLPDAVSRLGLRTRHRLGAAHAVTAFLGSLALASGRELRYPVKERGQEILVQLQRSGADSMIPLAALAALMGIVMGIQAKALMSPFGVEARLPEVISILTIQEMGPLLTAIVLAGRSGTAFAAELAALRSAEESGSRGDDVNTVGVLVLPRILALILAGPILFMIAAASSILGGMLVSFRISHLSAFGYLSEAAQAASIGFLLLGLAKIVLFSVIVGVVGCFKGWTMVSPREKAGKWAPSSFVTALFFIVLTDAFLNVLFRAL